MAGADDRFVKRWARLKREGRHGKAQPAAQPAGESASPESAKASPEAGGAEGTPAELPDIESLDKDSDYTVFLKDGVPEHLRLRALRKMWRSDPVLTFIDGLDDYDEDFRKAHLVADRLARRRLAKAAKDKVKRGAEKAEEGDRRPAEGGGATGGTSPEEGTESVAGATPEGEGETETDDDRAAEADADVFAAAEGRTTPEEPG